MIAMLAVLLATTSGAPCSGAVPSITSVTTTQAANGALTTYTLHVTVGNVGTAAQSGDVLQSVAILLDGEKKGQKGLPPLRPGAKYTFTYPVQRSVDAAEGSTAVDLNLIVARGAGAGPPACPAATTSSHIEI